MNILLYTNKYSNLIFEVSKLFSDALIVQSENFPLDYLTKSTIIITDSNIPYSLSSIHFIFSNIDQSMNSFLLFNESMKSILDLKYTVEKVNSIEKLTRDQTIESQKELLNHNIRNKLQAISLRSKLYADKTTSQFIDNTISELLGSIKSCL